MKKIPLALPQFAGEKALIITAAEHVAKFYSAEDGGVRTEAEIKIINPVYTDREGYFEKRGMGTTHASGSVYEPKKNYLQKKFIKKFEDTILKLSKHHNYTKVYYFCPIYLHTAIEDIIKTKLKNKSNTLVASGNYTAETPLRLIKRIKEYLESTKNTKLAKPMAEEVWKLLKKD